MAGFAGSKLACRGALLCPVLPCNPAPQTWHVAGQGITKPIGVGNTGFGIWKPDIQFPIPEKVEPVITLEPYTMWKPAMEFHTKGAAASYLPHLSMRHACAAHAYFR